MSFFKFPYTSYQQINLDWIMKTLNQIKDAIPLVQQASTIYTQALEALAAANEAVEAVTDDAAGAVSTANAAQAVAGQANTTAAQANQRAAYAETDAQAASANASTALSTAQSAASAASEAQVTADAAATATEWTLKGTLRKHTSSENTTVSFALGSEIKSIMLVFTTASSYGGRLNRVFELPISMVTESSSDGNTPYSASGLPVTFGDTVYIAASQEFINDYARFNISYDSQTGSITVTFVDDQFTIGNAPSLYCRVYAR